MDNLYFTLKNYFLFKNIRFFMKSFKHKWSLFLFSIYTSSWAKIFVKIKSFKKMSLNNNFSNYCVLSSYNSYDFYSKSVNLLSFNFSNTDWTNKIQFVRLSEFRGILALYRSSQCGHIRTNTNSLTLFMFLKQLQFFYKIFVLKLYLFCI